MFRALPAQPDPKPEETTMPDIDKPDPAPDWWCGACPHPDVCTPARGCAIQAEQHDRHRQADALIAAVETDLEKRKAEQISPWEQAARIFEQQAAEPPDLWDRPQPPDPWNRPQPE
jgi:hypothetical protein